MEILFTIISNEFVSCRKYFEVRFQYRFETCGKKMI